MSKLQQSTVDDIRGLVSGDYKLTDRRVTSFVDGYAKQPGCRDWLYSVACNLGLFGDHTLMEDLARVLGIDVPENGTGVSRFEVMRKLKDVTPEQKAELAEMAAIVKYELDDAIKSHKPELRKMIENEQKRIGTYIPEVVHPKDLSHKEKIRKFFSVRPRTFTPLSKIKMMLGKKATTESSVKTKQSNRRV